MHRDFFGKAGTGACLCAAVGATPCGCPLEKYYRLKLVRYLFKRKVSKKLRLKCHSFRYLQVVILHPKINPALIGESNTNRDRIAEVDRPCHCGSLHPVLLLVFGSVQITAINCYCQNVKLYLREPLAFAPHAARMP